MQVASQSPAQKMQKIMDHFVNTRVRSFKTPEEKNAHLQRFDKLPAPFKKQVSIARQYKHGFTEHNNDSLVFGPSTANVSEDTFASSSKLLTAPETVATSPLPLDPVASSSSTQVDEPKTLDKRKHTLSKDRSTSPPSNVASDSEIAPKSPGRSKKRKK